MPKAKIPFGPTYDEMLNPSHQDKKVRKEAEKALKENELDPINLFNIGWKNSKDGTVNKIVLPKALTGVDANIVVLLGKSAFRRWRDLRGISAAERAFSARVSPHGKTSATARFLRAAAEPSPV